MSDQLVDIISVIESALQSLADLAPTLKPAELRVLLELTRRALGSSGISVRASSRDLATRCKIGRSKAVAALDALSARQVIATRQGTATSAAAYRLNFLETLRISGPVLGPPPARPPSTNRPDQWSQIGATQVPIWDQSGPEMGPPTTGNTGLASRSANVDDSTVSPSILDRVLTSTPSKFDRDLVAYTRRYLHSYMTKLGRDDTNRPFAPGHPPHPPDDRIVAQVLAVADAPRLFHTLDALVAEQKPASTYGWFVTVLLQRIHGISWQETKAARAARRARPALSIVPAAGPVKDPAWQQETFDTLASIAQKKALR